MPNPYANFANKFKPNPSNKDSDNQTTIELINAIQQIINETYEAGLIDGAAGMMALNK